MGASAAGDAHPTDAAAISSPPLAAGRDGATAPVLDGEHDGAPVHGTGRLWGVCLAVLAAGLAVLLALILPGWWPWLRPPDSCLPTTRWE